MVSSDNGNKDDNNYAVRWYKKNDVTTVLVSKNNREEPCGLFKERFSMVGYKASCWECHSKSGIDPAMMMCFIAAFDKATSLRSTHLKNATGTSSRSIISSTSNLLLSSKSSSFLSNNLSRKKLSNLDQSTVVAERIENDNNTTPNPPPRTATFMNARAA